MSIAYVAAEVFTLKLMDPPTLTLNGSAKPSIVVLGLGTSQTDCGVPRCWFSHTTGLPQAARAGAAGETDRDAPTKSSTSGTARRRSSRERTRSLAPARIPLRAE